MQLYDLVLERVIELTTNFKHPIYLWGIPIIFVLLLILITRTFVRYSMDEAGAQKLRRIRVFVFITRFITLTLLCIALATPFTEISKESEGNPHAVVLIDKSGSMGQYDVDFVAELTKKIGEQLPTQIKEFGTSSDSPVGDALLGQNDHVLLISDGNANSGVDLMSTIELHAKQHDAAVYIDAPSTVPLGYPAKILVEVTTTKDSVTKNDGTNDAAVPLTVSVDGKIIAAQTTLGTIELSPELTTGFHKIEARITPINSDANQQNNVFYRVIQILEKPKVLVIAKEKTPLVTALFGLFDVTLAASLPSNQEQLSQYYAIVVEDQSASKMSNTKALADFLRDETGGKYGNGLVVFGGFNSYDRGGYYGSQFETLLPVKVGKPKRTLGENNIVFVIQVSGSTGAVKYEVGPDGKRREVIDTEPTIETIKAQAVSAVESLNLKNNVGVIAFGVSTEGQSFGSAEELMQHSVVKIADIKPLYTHKQELVEQIPRLVGGGTTAPDIAIRTAVDMLKDKSGDKTIIFLTNGRFSAGLGAGNEVPAKANTLAVVENARKRYNIKTQTIGVGSTDYAIFAKKVDESFLKLTATVGDSTYDRATNFASLIIKYGDPKEKGFGENFNLVPLSLTHFITKNVELDAIMNGYNEIAPKEGSRLLVSTDGGAPAITVWNYFNGRVAAVTVFTSNGLGPLLTGNNSDLIRNTVLWAVGDPTRKQEVRTEVSATIINVPAEITFVSKTPISGNCADTALSFDRNSGDTYIFTFTPTTTGFGTACTIPYAVNAESEYWHVGMSKTLENAVAVSEGGVFEYDEVEEIVKRIKTVSTKVTVEKTELRNPFIVLAIALFLLEIFIRRMIQIN